MKAVLFLALLASLLVGAQAGDASLAAAELAPGLLLTTSSPLAHTASSSDLCPVIKYATAVEPISESDLSALKSASGADGLYASQHASVAAPQSKSYRIVLTPLSYIQNASAPSVDWIDVHFKIGQGTQESMKMKSHPASSSSPAWFSFEPIFLSPADSLYFGHSISAGLVNCDTATVEFIPQRAEQQLQSVALEAHSQQEAAMLQPEDSQLSQGMGAATPAQSEAARQLQMPLAAGVVVGSAAACPAIAYTHKLDCGDDQCKVSFVNLSPNKPVDWVDVHLVKTDESTLRRFLSLSGSSSHQLALAAAEIPQLNLPMALGAGALGSMAAAGVVPSGHQMQGKVAAELSSKAQLNKFGVASLPATVMAQAGGTQVWQMGIPIIFKGGDLVGLSFTYSAGGAGCDTEIAFYQLNETDPNKIKIAQAQTQAQQPASQQEQTAGQVQVAAELQAAEESAPIASDDVQQPLGFRGSMQE